MPKKSSKKSSKKQAPAAERALIPHRAPNLTDLLQRAGLGKLSDVQQYLSAGGLANVLVEANLQQQSIGGPEVLQPVEQVGLVPLLTSVAGSRHSEAVASIKLLLYAGAAVNSTSNSTFWARTALMVACCNFCDVQVVDALLQGGADPCYQASSDGKSALHLAAAAGCTRTCRALHIASSGRALELRGKGVDLNATPLIAACAAEKFATVELLCTLGADLNHSSVTGATALMTAAANKRRTFILHFLLQQNGIQVNRCTDNGDTALMMAAYVGNDAAVKLLLQHGADACNINDSGNSAVFAAAAAGHVHVLKLLLQHGVDITVTRDGGFTLLVQAAASNQPRAAEYLINAGVSVHAADSYTTLCSTVCKQWH
jgi:ankyrin repeat protein